MSPTDPDPAPARRGRRGRPPAGGREAALAATLELLRERGVARLTTKEVAARAGVSEGSVFYHFKDRAGLLTAALEDRLGSLRPVPVDGPVTGGSRAALRSFAAGVTEFLDGAIPAMFAAQADDDLRTAMTGFLADRDLGPHRGVQAVAEFLRGQQERGVMPPDVDASVVALMLIGALFLRSAADPLFGPGYADGLPDADAVVETLITLLT